ncbi:hypothetical protein K491DRAFT_588907 [Lophiostoma macrostomum CBS 122681]|uniref:Thioesterase domain-containing protein n=1 Tax=Lophiostoma macrostomum CBS 122681 TaxID=1314788 RepID=A0A6A6TND7_9PLEO|nr:hypothetical protein K491DRAFT_588907 [Lophiostoma macrostomum CBS 122681]
MAASIAYLNSIPWCNALINDPSWTPTRTTSRVPKASSEDSFFAETLGTERTIRHCLTLRPSVGRDADVQFEEVRTIMELGDGLNGHPKICHGGFVATMLDEVCGVLITQNLEGKMRRAREKWGKSGDDGEGALGPHEGLNCFTAYLNTSYKKPVPTPGIVLCRAKFEKQERNKSYVSATIEDGMGTVFTRGEGMFVEVKQKL